VLLRFLVSASILFAVFARVPAVAADENKWLALNRSEIMQIFQVVDAKEVADEKGAPADVHLLRSGGDSVWVGVNKKLNFRLAMAGRGEKVHSIRVFIPILNLSKEQAEQTFKILAAFFEAAVPRWQDAGNWPKKSLDTSWSASANAMDRKPFNPNDIIAGGTIGEVTVSTFGVPPDIILYAATTRASCVPRLRNQDSSDIRNDPIQRLVC
jgi:hypothetical protein